MNRLPALPLAPPEREIADLARALKRANGPLLAMLNRLGGGLEAHMAALPPSLRAEVERVVMAALKAAHGVAGLGGLAPDIGRQGPMLAAMAAGAVGGAAGFAGALAELPVTVTLLLHAIRREAVAAGYDPDDMAVRAVCLEVFAAGAPMAADDGVNTAFLSARLTVTGPALHKIMAAVAPKLAAAMGQKLVAQAVPVLGAITGAGLNAVYLNYYREVARIRFALLRLAGQHGAELVLAEFAKATGAAKISGRRG